ncbi:lipid A deacylase LpxR family protein [bacterium]|nr:lipid A deacylase LpxR family protein [bacterium]MBU1989423.1 lipid A deacylase LpxR family protein [bacterium]
MKNKTALAYFLIFSVSLVRADQFSMHYYNDIFAGTDRHFTNGVSFCWLDDTKSRENSQGINAYTNFMLKTVDTIPSIDINEYKKYTAGASVSQMIITPNDIEIEEKQLDDIPYAGYLALSFFLFEWNSESFKEYRLSVGVIGPESGAQYVQNGFHRLIGNTEAAGWDHQLGTAYTVNALFRYGNISWQDTVLDYFKVDWFNNAGVQVGNFTTDLFASTMLRIGKNYINNFNVHYPYLREEASVLQVDEKHKHFGYSLTFGLNGELLAYSYILDEGKNEGYATNKNLLNASIYTGLDLFYDAHKITLFYQSQSPYIKKQKSADIIGGFMYSYQF